MDDVYKEHEFDVNKKYDYDVKKRRVKMMVEAISVGEKKDVASWLSKPRARKKDEPFVMRCSNKKERVPVKKLVGKYLVVYCLDLARFADDLVGSYNYVITLCSELSTKAEVFVLVVVKPARDEKDERRKIEIDRFLSSFEGGCLYMPMIDVSARNKVCKSVGLVPKNPNKEKVVVVGPKGKVLLNSDHYLTMYGAASFPFTKKHLKSLEKAADKMVFRLDPFHTVMREGFFHDLFKPRVPVSLKELLQCDSLKRFDGEMVPLSKLKDKLVGLYLYIDGSFMDKLIDVQQQCTMKELDFEIVFLDLVRFTDCLVSSSSSSSEIGKVKSWLEFPFNYSICRSLWRYCNMCSTDRLIVLPPGGQQSDMNGKSVIKKYGIEAYPFTRWSILEKKLLSLKSLTLDSLLSSEEEGPAFLVPIHGGPDVPPCVFDGNHVLLYKDFFDHRHNKGICSLLRERFPEIQSKHPSVVVVVVPLSSVLPTDQVAGMPWFVLRRTCSNLTKYKKDFDHVIAFGKEGKLLSRNAVPYLSGNVASLFDDHLGRQIAAELAYMGLDDAD